MTTYIQFVILSASEGSRFVMINILVQSSPGIRVRHDEHIHVDFAIPCKKKK